MKPKIQIPAAPAYFSSKALALWSSIHTEYALECDATVLLQIALENLDLGDQARDLLRADGFSLDGRKHPASDSAKLHDGLYLRCMRQLGLDVIAKGPQVGKRAA